MTGVINRHCRNYITLVAKNVARANGTDLTKTIAGSWAAIVFHIFLLLPGSWGFI
jgi:hypothetical protein